MGSCLRAWALTHICEMLDKSLALPIFTPLSTVSLPYAILTHILDIFASDYHCMILCIFILAPKHHIS